MATIERTTSMEEYITRSEFDRLLKEEVRRQLQEQRHTEEIKAVRVDVHNVDVETIKQELKTVSDTWLEVLQEHYTEHMARFEKIESTMAAKEDLKVMKEEIIDA